MLDLSFSDPDKKGHCGKCGTALGYREFTVKATTEGEDDRTFRLPFDRCACYAELPHQRFEKQQENKAPQSWRDCTLGQLDWDTDRAPAIVKHREEIRKFYDTLPLRLKNGNGLTLFGDRGTCKSTLAAIMLTKAAKDGFTGAFRSAKELCNGWMFSDYTKRDAFQEEAMTVSLLVIDEMGLEPANQYSLTTLNEVIDTRYRNRKAVMVTFNNDVAWLDARYRGIDAQGIPRIFDRLKERNKMLEFKGPSYRQHIRADW